MPRSSRAGWTPDDLRRLIVIGTASLCLLIFVLGTMLGILYGKISADSLGTVEGIGKAGGILGLGMIIFFVIQTSLKKGAKEANE